MGAASCFRCHPPAEDASPRDVVPAAGPNIIGAYVNGIPLDLSSKGGTWSQMTQATADIGPLLTPGQNILYLYKRDTGCTVSGIIAREDVIQDFSLIGLGTLSGIASADGSPLPSVTVRPEASGGYAQETSTGATGSYGFTAIPTGPGEVSILIPTGYAAVSPATGSAPVDVTAGTALVQDFALAGFADLQGSVLADGSPIASVIVDLVAAGSHIQFAVTDATGSPIHDRSECRPCDGEPGVPADRITDRGRTIGQ